MKTSTSLRQNSSYFYLIGLLSFLLASCGSYQNTSYYDNDGVYGKSTNTYAQTTSTNANVNNQYKDYFKSLQDENQPTEIFTDVDNYTSNYAVNDSTQTASTTAYPGWGSGTTETSVTYYSDPSFYWGIGFGWGYPYYGYGWGYPYYGWGYYPGWGYPGWGYPGYGYGYYNNYNYSYGRRGSAAYYGSRGYSSRDYSYASRGSYAGRNYAGRSATTFNGRDYANRSSYTTNNRGYSDFRRSSSVNGRTYSSPTFTDRRSTAQGQSSGYDYANRRSSAGTTNRSYSPSSDYSSRSYSPSPSRSMNSGGGGSARGYSGGGGGGGGRSYGGGGGGGRR
ncbi:hypothetical protein [Flavobacterium daemonense]|uniref:hypothetical protein n=1 Tax=Flavobacterium daemonense TaxID=1393049 RepID=UPI001B87EFAD|nr:hypothetical protein [Flavobacterium daemonense]